MKAAAVASGNPRAILPPATGDMGGGTLTLSQLVQRIRRAFPGQDFLVHPTVKVTGGGAHLEAWFDVWLYHATGRIVVERAPTPAAAWAGIEAKANLKPPALDVFDVESTLALRERRRA